jgi:Fic family protein
MVSAAARRSGRPGWPAISARRVRWDDTAGLAVPSPGRGASGPYEAAVAAGIADVADVPLSPSAATLATEAATEIARFDAEVGAEIAPFAAMLLRSESAASSRIENLTASAKAIALAEAGAVGGQSNAAIIVANTTAMRAAIDLADRLDPAAILAMHDALLGPVHPEWAGRWREDQVWVGGSDYSPHGALFVPPHQDDVPGDIDDLCAFMARDDLPPLVQAAVAHAQFETIHPFPDGNGRTGRALVHSLLRGKGLTRKVTVPVSAGLLSNTNAYFDALTAYRGGDPEQIVAMMSHASFAAVNNGRQLVTELRELRAGWDDRITARRDATAWRVADVLLGQPVGESTTLQRDLGVSAPVALGAIEQLVTAGVLSKVSGRHRDRKYSSPEILRALDAFAVRAGRRGGF